MRIEDVNLGGGLYRLDVTPTHRGEDVTKVPVSYMDEIMRNVVRRKKEQDCRHEECRCHKHECCHHEVKKSQWPLGEPDGIDAHIDRPRREMYGGWDAEEGFQKDLKKYREAERAIKACTWPCREPMKGTEDPANFINPCDITDKKDGWGVSCTRDFDGEVEELRAALKRLARAVFEDLL